MKNDFADRPILITGCARSGTSMTAGIIHLAGAHGGDCFGTTRFNRKGMFENKKIRQHLVKPFLRSINVDPLGQKPLPDIEAVKLVSNKTVEEWRSFVVNTMRSEGYNGNGHWFYKGAKMCLKWPVWQRAFPEARWIIVRRHSEDIVRSCLKTSFMKAYKTREGWLEWVEQHKERFLEMEAAGMDIQYVWPQKMIDFDLKEIKNVILKLGLDWDQQKVEDFIEPAYWSGKGFSNG